MGLKYYTPSEVSELLGVSLTTVYSWVQQGRLKSYKFGKSVKSRTRILDSDLVDFCKRNFVEREKIKEQ